MPLSGQGQPGLKARMILNYSQGVLCIRNFKEGDEAFRGKKNALAFGLRQTWV